MTQQELQQRLNQPYSTDNWKQVVTEVFPNVQLFDPVLTIPVENSKVESFRQLGNVRLQDGKSLALFELKLKSNVNILRNRVELNNLVSQYIDQEQNHGVLSIFEQGGEDYRFTFSAKATTYEEEESDFVTKKTDTKRFTYLLGKNESCKTPALRLHDLSTKKAEADIHTIQDAFSVEKLSKEFFEEYKVHYTRMVNYLIETPSYRVALFKEDDKAIRDFVKLTLGRLVFIQFLQKKRWMGVPATAAGWDSGDPHFLKHSFQNYVVKDLFYSHFLEPLFYEALNLDGRPNQVFAPTGTKVPYLNGGLFEKGKESTHLINFPPALFEELFAFFDRYNFTIDESDPKEQEVGIDPEMLGHIFENLLEDNKDKGAFYTPKEIVHYMCQESLLEYLKTFLKGAGKWPKSETEQLQLKEGLSNFIKKKEGDSIVDYSRELAIALRDVKICDPAIGSGAFPMGLLTEIFHAVYLLFQANPAVVGQEWGMDEWKPNVVKKNIIQNSIYGVDIEKGAVDIARLRFWLSLIVDEPEPEALPNLDYKIVVGNSLISKLGDTVIDIDWSLDTTSHGLYGADLAQQKAELLKQISAKQKEFFNPENDKRTLAAEIRNLKIDLLINQLELMVRTKGIETQPTRNTRKITLQTSLYLQTLGWKKSIDQLKDLKIHPEKILPFFDRKLDFPELLNELVAENPGFDIVIGNPPYINLESNPNLSAELEINNFETYAKRGDIYCIFYEQGLNHLKKEGVLTYITSNKWLSAAYGKKTRRFLLDKSNPIKLLDFKETLLFESATVFTNILITKKEKNSNNLTSCIIDKKYKIQNSITDYFYANNVNISDLDEGIWIISGKSSLDINEKIESKSSSLKELEIFISRGQTTGCNAAFIIDEAKKSQLIEKNINNGQRIKPILRGRQITKYNHQFDGDYLIISPYNMHQNLTTEYGDLYEHLSDFYQILSERGQVLNGQHHWLELDNNPTLDALLNYEKPKIIWKEISADACFSFDDEGYYLPNTSYFLIGEDLHYLLGVLNSIVSDFYFFQITPQIAGGSKRYTKQYVEMLRIPNMENSSKNSISELSKKIIIAKKANKESAIYQTQIDELLFNFFEFTMEEKMLIESSKRIIH